LCSKKKDISECTFFHGNFHNYNSESGIMFDGPKKIMSSLMEKFTHIGQYRLMFCEIGSTELHGIKNYCQNNIDKYEITTLDMTKYKYDINGGPPEDFLAFGFDLYHESGVFKNNAIQSEQTIYQINSKTENSNNTEEQNKYQSAYYDTTLFGRQDFVMTNDAKNQWIEPNEINNYNFKNVNDAWNAKNTVHKFNLKGILRSDGNDSQLISQFKNRIYGTFFLNLMRLMKINTEYRFAIPITIFNPRMDSKNSDECISAQKYWLKDYDEYYMGSDYSYEERLCKIDRISNHPNNFQRPFKTKYKYNTTSDTDFKLSDADLKNKQLKYQVFSAKIVKPKIWVKRENNNVIAPNTDYTYNFELYNYSRFNESRDLKFYQAYSSGSFKDANNGEYNMSFSSKFPNYAPVKKDDQYLSWMDDSN